MFKFFVGPLVFTDAVRAFTEVFIVLAFLDEFHAAFVLFLFFEDFFADHNDTVSFFVDSFVYFLNNLITHLVVNLFDSFVKLFIIFRLDFLDHVIRISKLKVELSPLKVIPDIHGIINDSPDGPQYHDHIKGR